MTAAEVLTTLRARGARVRVLADGTLGVTPRTALDHRLRAEVRARASEIAALLRRSSTMPHPGPSVPRPCGRCGGAVLWLADDLGALLRCAACSPCPDPRRARWVFAADPADPAGILVSPVTLPALAALEWSDPAAVDAVLRLAAEADRGVAGALVQFLTRVREIVSAHEAHA